MKNNLENTESKENQEELKEVKQSEEEKDNAGKSPTRYNDWENKGRAIDF